MDAPSLTITIDGITFSLMCQGTNQSTGYQHVLLQSTTQTETLKIMLYRSFSESGIFRVYCVGYSGAFEKGMHYITSSSIHILLQKFILDNLHILEINGQMIINNMPDQFSETNRELINHLGSCTRMQETKSFNSCIVRAQNPFFHSPLFHSSPFKQQIGEYVDVFDLVRKAYKIYSDKLESIFEVVGKQTFCGKHTFSTVGYKIEGELFSVEIRNKSNHDEKYQVLYCKYVFTNLFANKLNKLAKTNGYLTNLPCFSTPYPCIINIIPSNAKVTKFGTYDVTVDFGIYGWKILEYSSQFFKNEYRLSSYEMMARSVIKKPDELDCYEKDQVYSYQDERYKRTLTIVDMVNEELTYKFIGDLMDNLFPINQVEK